MKKTLLTLGLLGTMGSAYAQTPVFQLLNTDPNNIVTLPNAQPVRTVTLSSRVSWNTMRELVGNPLPPPSSVSRTKDGGVTYNFEPVPALTGQATANASPINGDTAFVCQYPNAAGSPNGGEILRTFNGGVSWRKVSGTAFTGPEAFADFVHMFDATNGVAVGDPSPAASHNFEVVVTSNGGTTWTRIPASAIPTANTDGLEAAIVNSFATLGNNIWFATGHSNGAPAPNTIFYPVRIYRSTDRGLTWAASAELPTLLGSADVSFRDPLNGIATNFAGTPAVVTMYRTSDGGATWTDISSLVQTNGARGRYYTFDLDNIPASPALPTGAFVSVGRQVTPSTPLQRADDGASVSVDGINWIDIDRGVDTPGATRSAFYVTSDFISPTVGYVGSRTNNATATVPGAGGFYKYVGPRILSSRAAALPASTLSAFPNPSLNGVFEVKMAAGLRTASELTVTDALGRRVQTRSLNGSASDSGILSVDLSKQAPGIYILSVRNAEGVATKKLVIQ